MQVLFRVNPHLQGHLCNPHGIRRGGHQQRGLKILHVHKLLLGIAGGGRHNGRAHLFQSVVKAKGACKHAIAKTDLGHILVRCAAGNRKPGHALLPYFQVIFRITHNRWLAGCPAGRMDPAQLFSWHREQAIRIIVPHILLCCKWKFFQVLQGLYVFRLHAGSFHLGTVSGHPLIVAGHRFLQAG